MKHGTPVTAVMAAFVVMTACGAPPTQPKPPVVQPPVIVDPPSPPPPPPPTFAVTKIMAFGDSLTEGDPPAPGEIRLRPVHDTSGPGGKTSYPYKLYAMLTTTYPTSGIQVFNHGLGGERAESSGTRARLVEAIAAHQPQVLLLMHGTNDLLNEAPQNAIVDAVEELMELAQARNVQVFLAGLPPNQRPPAAAQVQEYNERLRNLALARSVPFVDIFPNIDAQTMMDADGLHINEAGNQRIAEVFYAALKPRYHRDPQ